MDVQNQDALRLTPSNTRTALLFAAMIIWCILGVSSYAAAGGILPLALSIVGLSGAIVYGLMLLPGSSYLDAAPQGLTISTAYRKRSYAWSEIESFYAEKIWTREVVKYRLNAGAGGTGAESKSVREETLPDTYGLSAEELATRLNGYRIRYR